VIVHHGFDEGLISVSIIIREAFVSFRSNFVNDCPIMMTTSINNAVNAPSLHEEGYCDVEVVG
jgi:hypothetical protein